MTDNFSHPAQELGGVLPLIYTATSKHYFYFRMHISKFVIEHGGVPLNPFMIYDYFLLDTVERDVVRTGNNNLVRRCDEVWVFGPVSNGVLAEIQLAKAAGKTIKYFAIEKSQQIVPISPEHVVLEDDVKEFRNTL